MRAICQLHPVAIQVLSRKWLIHLQRRGPEHGWSDWNSTDQFYISQNVLKGKIYKKYITVLDFNNMCSSYYMCSFQLFLLISSPYRFPAAQTSPAALLPETGSHPSGSHTGCTPLARCFQAPAKMGPTISGGWWLSQPPGLDYATVSWNHRLKWLWKEHFETTN